MTLTLPMGKWTLDNANQWSVISGARGGVVCLTGSGHDVVFFMSRQL